MKVISLSQPWATCVVIGAKRYETRSWRTNYRGPLLIHAAKRYPSDAKHFAFRLFFDSGDGNKSLLQNHHPLLHEGFLKALVYAEHLPTGAIIGKVKLIDCIPTESVRDCLSAQEKLLGNYEDGRWAWKLENYEMFDKPVPAKGALGLWDWEEKTSYEAELERGRGRLAL